MNCEIVAVGTELLLGQIADTNSAWMGERLAELGIDSYYQTKVGDNFERMCEVIGQAVGRSDAVIVCGGLGPTHDDITREAIAAVMGVELVRDDAVAERIRGFFAGRGREMPESNLRQADVPEGATVSPMIPGTAPGLMCPVRSGESGGASGGGADKVIYAVPGVPSEMMELLAQWVLPDLQRRAGVTEVIASRTLRTWGNSESGLADRLAPTIARLEEEKHATLAFLASAKDGLKVRLTAKAGSAAAVKQVLDAEEAAVRAVIGDEAVFGVDDETLEGAVLALCRERGETLATAESVTGGLVAARLASVPGASEVFRGGLVGYMSEVKFDLLGVPPGPVVSTEVAEQMALGACELLGASCAIASTGVAGPDSLEGHPPGTVCLATAVRGEVESLRFELPFARDQVQLLAVMTVLNSLRLRLLGLDGGGGRESRLN